MHLACLSGNIGNEILEILLSHNSSNATIRNENNGWNPFHIAVSKDNKFQVNLLLKFKDIDINEQSNFQTNSNKFLF